MALSVKWPFFARHLTCLTERLARASALTLSITSEFKALFTWRQGAPANRATRLGGLKHSPPLHASHLGEIVSRAGANHNKQDGGQQKRFGFSVSRAIILHSTN